ncbi:hypothetical protein ZWY2020_028756 [Hordeum vulgare]|nr:hypothetical protein ZWY2020_028756 [Hordeum vulgare]
MDLDRLTRRDGAHQHPHLASSSSFFFSSCSPCACRSRRTGKAVITAFAAGSRCSADPACPEPIEQHNVNSLSVASGPANTQCYRRRDFAAVALLPFLLPHVDMASAADSYDGSIIRDGVRNVLSKVKAAGVLRLVFHDAGTFDISDKSGGMNGSIIYEADRPENTGLKTLDVVALKTSFGKRGFRHRRWSFIWSSHNWGKGFGNPNAFDSIYFKVLLEKPRPTSYDECLRYSTEPDTDRPIDAGDTKLLAGGSTSITEDQDKFLRFQRCIYQACKQWSLVENNS